MIQLIIADNCKTSAGILAGLLADHGVHPVAHRLPDYQGDVSAAEAVVSWGVPVSGDRPTLNGNAARLNKLEQLVKLQEAGVRVPRFYLGDINPLNVIKFPLLARRLNHVDGTDIMPVLQAEEMPWRRTAGADFFTEYVPRAEEIRVFVYRRQHLATYRKVLHDASLYREIGCTHRNGFEFEYQDAEIEEATVLAARAVQALELDFGAVDILKGTDGNWYVLEVNTAPGVGTRNSVAARKLARKIARWEELGYPSRRTNV